MATGIMAVKRKAKMAEGKQTINSAPESEGKSHDALKKENFDRAKMLSDFFGMIIRLGFIMAATAYLIKQMPLYPGFLGSVITVTSILFIVLLCVLLWRVGLIIYYVLIEQFSNDHENPNWFPRIVSLAFTILSLLGIGAIGVMIALNTPTFWK